ncbi:MAG: DUF839 domain-containing protein [Kofleriaceae bacterium]
MRSGERTRGAREHVDRLDRPTAKPQVATLALLASLAGACGDDRRPRPAGEDGGVRACATELRRDSSVAGVPLDRGLSAVVALSYCDAANTGASDVAGYVKVLVERWAAGQLGEVPFPLAAEATDTLRAIPGLVPDLVVKWLDPLTNDPDPARALRFGANNDYLAYFGDGWTGTPMFQGDDRAGWMWVNHEYVAGVPPLPTAAPSSQHHTLATLLHALGVLATEPASTVWSNAELARYTEQFKKNVGGSWLRVVQDSTGDWAVDRSRPALRYDATDSTLARVTGLVVSADHDDEGAALPPNVVTGIHHDCSGGVTPWGTVITAEENVQAAYGDLETAWTTGQRFVPGAGFDPGAMITFDTAPSPTGEFGISGDPNALHPRDAYGFLVEIDPGRPPSEYYGRLGGGQGHRKLGALGRANWENATFAVNREWMLIPDRPVVLYAGNDRRSGHVYKFVSARPYRTTMTKDQIRALLDDGKVYVAHFAGLDNATGRALLSTGVAPTEAAPGHGRWVELSLTSPDVAPNAAGLGEAGKTVGEALADPSWNGLGGFASSDDVRRALFTASLKVGAMELNRPEDVEYNPRDLSGRPRIYVSFTNDADQVALDQEGRLYPPAVHAAQSPNRGDVLGAIYAIEEQAWDDSSSSRAFAYWEAWAGRRGEDDFAAASPDNLLLDRDGGVWFCTDGNLSVNGRAEGVYYLDLDPAHAQGARPSFGKAFRVAATPSDAEATGPAFSSGMGTLFFSVQHPGQGQPSSWPPR